MSWRFSHADAKRFYDRLGRLQDTQGWYEDRAVAAMCEAGRFETAHRVGEFGCGTGRIAAEILRGPLPDDAHFHAFDVSETMVALTAERLADWPHRALAVRTGGAPELPVVDAAFDRLIATYVLDLLSEGDIAAFVAGARRALEPGGLLCIVSLTCPDRGAARAIALLWKQLQGWFPKAVGGCRPISVAAALGPAEWDIRFRQLVVQALVPSEVVVAARR